MIRYWVAFKILGSPSILSIKTTINATNIVVGCPSNWPVIPVDSGKRICRPFNGCLVPLIECLFSRICLWLPLSEFKVIVLKHLKVPLF